MQQFTCDTTNIKIKFKYELPKNYVVLVYDEKVPRNFWRIAMVTMVLSNRDSEIKGAIARIKETNAILKSHVNKLVPTEFKRIMTLTKQKGNGTKVKMRSSRNQ